MCRQARAAEQPAPAGDAVLPRFGTLQTPFARLNAVEEAGSHQDIHGACMTYLQWLYTIRCSMCSGGGRMGPL